MEFVVFFVVVWLLYLLRDIFLDIIRELTRDDLPRDRDAGHWHVHDYSVFSPEQHSDVCSCGDAIAHVHQFNRAGVCRCGEER